MAHMYILGKDRIRNWGSIRLSQIAFRCARAAIMAIWAAVWSTGMAITQAAKDIVLLRDAFADGSSRVSAILITQRMGYSVNAVQISLRRRRNSI